MNYYPHHIGDYLRDTAHLSAIEDGTYRRMLDLYYASEKPLPLDFEWLCKLVRARDEGEQEAAHVVLQQFFAKSADGWRNKRADEEIAKARKRIKAAKHNGKTGGRPKTQPVRSNNPVGLRTDNPSESSQKPKAKDQKPKEELLTAIAPSAKAPDAAVGVNGSAVCYIPINDGTEFGVSQQLADELQKLYPAVDVMQTLNEIRGWNIAKPERRKTRRGVVAHINAWMSKEQNRGPKR